jgi:protein-S-isoprenylcysteine O-methyltransferase Ste14
MAEQERTAWSRIARRIRVPLGFVFGVLYLWLAQPKWISIALGMIFILPGLLVRAIASGHVRKNETLATSGPYAYTRNPLYLGSLLMGVGFGVAARSWWIGLLLLAMFFLIYVPVISDEEKFLRKKFPEFEQYAREVPRLFPRLLPHRAELSGTGGSFSTELFLKHREYNAALGVAIMLGALVIKLIWLR